MGAYKLIWSSAYHLDHESDLHSNEHLLINGKNRVFSLLAQLVEHWTYIAEVMGSNLVWAWSFFFRPYFYHCLSSTHYCKDCFHIYFFICSSDDIHSQKRKQLEIIECMKTFNTTIFTHQTRCIYINICLSNMEGHMRGGTSGSSTKLSSFDSEIVLTLPESLCLVLSWLLFAILLKSISLLILGSTSNRSWWIL